MLNALRRRELERQAREHRRDLELREQVLHDCSHELRTLLTPILGCLPVAPGRPGARGAQQCAAVIAEQGRWLLVVMGRLLAVPAVTDGTPDAVLEPLVSDSAAVARRVVAAPAPSYKPPTVRSWWTCLRPSGATGKPSRLGGKTPLARLSLRPGRSEAAVRRRRHVSLQQTNGDPTSMPATRVETRQQDTRTARRDRRT